jgi:hypothetical protein
MELVNRDVLHADVASHVLLRIAVDASDIHTPLPAEWLIEHAEVDNELTVHVLRRAIRTGHAAAGDNNGPDQAGIDIAALVHM